MADTYALTVSIPEGGAVNPESPSGIKDANSYVKLIAMPNPGWVFYGWKVDDELYSSDVYLVLQMTQDYAVEVLFLKEYYSLECSSSIGGTVTGLMNKVPYGKYVELIAVPDDGYEFTEWLGDLTGETNPGEVYVTGNIKFGAKFTEI